MNIKNWFALPGLCLAVSGALSAAVRVYTGAVAETREATFFAFDLDSIPFRRNLQLTMVPPSKHPEPVLSPGPAGAPDEVHAQFYGSVIKVASKYRMWYCGLSVVTPGERTPEKLTSWRCYA